MNARLVSFWERLGRATLLAAAFLLPLAYYLQTFDPALIKHLTLGIAATLAAACWAARQIEAGRFEIPASRVFPALLTAVALAWALFSYAAAGSGAASCLPALSSVSFLLLFGAVLLGPVSVGFGDALSSALLAAGALAAASLGFAALEPAERANWAVLSAAVLPLALARWSDPEAGFWARACAVVGALCAVGSVLAFGGADAFAALAVGGFAYGAACASHLNDERQKTSGIVGFGTVPLAAWAFASRPDALLLAEAGRWQGARFAAEAAWSSQPWSGTGLGTLVGGAPEPFAAAAETGALGLALWTLFAATALWLSWREIRRRAAHGEYKCAGLIAGQRSAYAALLAAGILGTATRSPATGAAFWLLAASLIGLSTERGASHVYVRPIPAPAMLRRVLLLPVAAAVAFVVTWSGAQWRFDLNLNRGVFEKQNGSPQEALKYLALVGADHHEAARARFLSGSIHDEQGDLESALVLYREATRLDPAHAQAGLKEGIVLARMGYYRESQEALSAFLAARPDDARAYEILIDVEQSLGRNDAARDAALQLVRLNPEEPRYWRLLAEQYHGLRRVRTARRLFDKATRTGELVKLQNEATRG